MKKSLIIEIVTIVLGGVILGGLVYMRSKEPKIVVVRPTSTCPTDLMMCPDGTSIPRSGPDCEFASCKQELPSYLQKQPEQTATSSAQEKNISPEETVNKKTSTSPVVSTNLFTKITKTATSFFKNVITNTNNTVSSGIRETVPATPAQNRPTQEQTPVTPPSIINETRYTIVDGNLVDTKGNVIVMTASTTPTPTTASWSNHTVNVVPVNNIPPVVGAIPVNGLPGKYYLSENSYGNIENCEFSNRIYILDTLTNTKTLMYEENSILLSTNDPRACTSEMFLLATDNEKLVLKYHTIGTNMTCDSTWSEPEKTWYIDVTKPTDGTRRYVISSALYTQAEESEAACRLNHETGTTTEAQVNGG